MQIPRRFPAALVALGAVAIAGCGDSSNEKSSAAGGNPADRAFVAQMIPHHQSAVAMAHIAQRRGSSVFVDALADDIVLTQTVEIAAMRHADQRLQSASVTKGSLGVPEHMAGMSGDIASLNSATPFDAAFMRMMISHHQGAVAMAGAELRRGEDAVLKTLAKNIIAAQQREIRQMRKQIARAGPARTTKMHGGHTG